MNLNYYYASVPEWFTYVPATYTTSTTNDPYIYVPSTFERQQERFRDTLARRRGRLLALELDCAIKGDSV